MVALKKVSKSGIPAVNKVRRMLSLSDVSAEDPEGLAAAGFELAAEEPLIEDAIATGAPAAPADPSVAKIESIKGIIGREDVDKGIKKEGEELVSRLEEAGNAFKAADEFINANSASAGAFGEEPAV